jgi:hypothetical protein
MEMAGNMVTIMNMENTENMAATTNMVNTGGMGEVKVTADTAVEAMVVADTANIRSSSASADLFCV